MKQFLILLIIAGLFGFTLTSLNSGTPQPARKPNIVFIVVDQWRAQATGYAGDKNVQTPNLNKLASQSLNLKNAVSGMPVCTPYRASLLTGQYPLTTGVFMNDVMLDTTKTTLAKVYKKEGYQTGFIGKWHIDGHGRTSYIPENRRQGFDYWKALECTHNYNQSPYYAGNSDKKLFWEGYDAIAQTTDAIRFINEQAKKPDPFMLFLSIGPPHDPYQTAPENYKKLYADKEIKINPNVPQEFREKATKDLKGYYAHVTAIDDCVGKVWETLKQAGIENNTIFIFTADHGDLLGAHGSWNKQQPYEESIRVPFLIHYPATFGNTGKTSPILINSPDIMPTLLGLTQTKIPTSVEGVDFSGVLKGTNPNKVTHTLISCVQPFGQWNRSKGGREYRGVVTTQYTYTRDLKGPWLLFDNTKDPFQQNNLIGQPAFAATQQKLNNLLSATLKQRKDEFKPGMEYVKQWNYVVDETETVPYKNINFEGKPILE
ncbi:sulfatase [Adhaeribacter swui]|uniref:Sulfatase n=1 Tax=Adhaeribacter swui TaxID=2086471 RepID=A0A7G7G4V3_9BACT|nr:sulfatase [Adhaeribacter swui]QNF32187.1 sulfatase [Adhaeribacter swui]